MGDDEKDLEVTIGEGEGNVQTSPAEKTSKKKKEKEEVLTAGDPADVPEVEVKVKKTDDATKAKQVQAGLIHLASMTLPGPDFEDFKKAYPGIFE